MCKNTTKDYLGLSRTMPPGLKQTSSVINIGFRVEETAANTFTQTAVDLNLDPLNREVFVIQAINLDPGTPDLVPALTTGVNTSLTATSQTDTVGLQESNCFAAAGNFIKQAVGGTADGGVPFTTGFFETPTGVGLQYIGIISTNDFFIQVKGQNNLAAKALAGKLYGYRAVASADIYAALVQSEVLSA